MKAVQGDHRSLPSLTCFHTGGKCHWWAVMRSSSSALAVQGKKDSGWLVLGREGEETWVVRVEPLTSPAPHCSPGLETVPGCTKASSAWKKCRDLLATSPGLVATLLVADRGGTLTSAGRSLSDQQQHPGSPCLAPNRSRGSCPAPGQAMRAAAQGSAKKGQDRMDITVLRSGAPQPGALKIQSFVSY